MEEIYIHYLDFKNSIPAVSTQNDDGSYSIFLNTRLSSDQQTKAYMHELTHIARQDFDSKASVNRIECYVHGLNPV